jgi:hypothetical protein
MSMLSDRGRTRVLGALEERQFTLVGGLAEMGIAYRGVVWERPLLVLGTV